MLHTHKVQTLLQCFRHDMWEVFLGISILLSERLRPSDSRNSALVGQRFKKKPHNQIAVVLGVADSQQCTDPPPKSPSQQPPHGVWAHHHCTHLKITTLTSNDPYQCGTSGSDFLLMEIGRCFNQTFHQRVTWCVVIDFLDDLTLKTWASPMVLFPPESFHCTTVWVIWHRTLHPQPLELFRRPDTCGLSPPCLTDHKIAAEVWRCRGACLRAQPRVRGRPVICHRLAARSVATDPSFNMNSISAVRASHLHPVRNHRHVYLSFTPDPPIDEDASSKRET